ncbi:hypothetical protein WDW89_17885 [Deltaproteobacteria bacterium TL4]
MRWAINQFYPLSESKKAGTQIVVTLLQCYPLTRACLESLGKRLLSELEWGFFTSEIEFIQEGISGKDMFLLCQGKVDVLVNQQFVVQMKAPELLGDKALVDPQSKRAATIRASENERILLIKIPMESFVRNFNSKIPDSEFAQEMGIYSSVFQTIQHRLFEFIYLQKNTWEEVSTTLKLINSQFIAKTLDNKRPLNWDLLTWTYVKKYLAEKLHFAWPRQLELNAQSLRDNLYDLLELRHPRQDFAGNEFQYLVYKNEVWREWLMELSEAVLRELPAEERPFQIHDVELFNPRNYHVRISNVLRGIESHFTPKKPPLPFSEFFEKGEHAHEFDLNAYLSNFENTFQIKSPKRAQAQVAQRMASIAAECENQFNASLVKMHLFLEKAKSKAIVVSESQVEAERLENKAQKYIAMILKGIHRYSKATNLATSKKNVSIKYTPTQTPTMKTLCNASGSKAMQMEINHAFQRLTTLFELTNKKISYAFIRESVGICQVSLGDDIPSSELECHYWIPLSQPVCLMRDIDNLGQLKPGCLIGGETWLEPSEDPEKATPNPYFIRNQVTQPTLFLVFSQTSMPWAFENKPNFDKFLNSHLPLMQWFFDKHLEQILYWVEQRDRLFQKKLEVEQIIRLESKIKAFEQSHVQLDSAHYRLVCRLLKNTFSVPIDPQTPIAMDQIAKKVYNHLIRQIGEEHPELRLEERGNQAYTQWRYVLSEIVHLLERYTPKNKDNEKPPLPIFEIIVSDLKELDQKVLKDSKQTYDELLGEHPTLNLLNIVEEESLPSPYLMIDYFRKRLRVLSKHIQHLASESFDYAQQIQQLNQKRPEVATEGTRIEYIQSNVEKLVHYLEIESS